jgi:hypothetical protein
MCTVGLPAVSVEIKGGARRRYETGANLSAFVIISAARAHILQNASTANATAAAKINESLRLIAQLEYIYRRARPETMWFELLFRKFVK